jgi:hypothetical protein
MTSRCLVLIEQFVDRLVDLRLQLGNIRRRDAFAIGFQRAQQFLDASLGGRDRNRLFLAFLHIPAVHGPEDEIGRRY